MGISMEHHFPRPDGGQSASVSPRSPSSPRGQQLVAERRSFLRKAMGPARLREAKESCGSPGENANPSSVPSSNKRVGDSGSKEQCTTVVSNMFVIHGAHS